MTIFRRFCALLVVVGTLAPATPGSAQVESALSGYDLSPSGGTSAALPASLRELSGLATTHDGRLFGHQDERASIVELDPETGAILKSFSVGRTGLRGDFEGLAIAGDRFFLMTSRGSIVEFREGENGRATGYELYSLNLDRVCELEGLAYDRGADALLIPCKNPRLKRLEDHVVVFSVPLETMTPSGEPRVFLPLDELDDADLGENFSPSAIEVHPKTGTLILLAARQEMILEVDPSGALLAGFEFKRRNHPQPEGLAFLPDGTMVIGDEGQNGPGRLTLYPPLPGGGHP